LVFVSDTADPGRTRATSAAVAATSTIEPLKGFDLDFEA
jgi:hypothetical protein